MLLSIIIPTYNRSNTLEICLESLLQVDLPDKTFELIIVDNNSTDNTKDVINKIILKYHFYNIKYIFESRPGVHFARNHAAKISFGKYLYFTDDDMNFEKNSIKELLNLFELDSKIATVTGCVLPIWPNNVPEWVIKCCNNYLLSLNSPNYDLIISKFDCNVFSCHQMIRRDIFFNSGGFNPENTEGTWIGDGETGLNNAIKKLGFKFAFTNKSIIYHMIPETRVTQSYLVKRFINQGNADSYSFFRNYKDVEFVLLKSSFLIFLKLFKISISFLLSYLINNDKWHLNHGRIFYYIARLKYNFKLLINSDFKYLVLKTNWIDE